MKASFYLLLFFFNTASFATTKANAILGIWFTEVKDAKIEVYKKANKYYGRAIWLAEPKDEDGKEVVDEHNPNESLNNRPILGIDILIGFVYDDGEWNGRIYDPKNGETYTAKLWMEGRSLKVRGYLGWFFDTKTWTRP